MITGCMIFEFTDNPLPLSAPQTKNSCNELNFKKIIGWQYKIRSIPQNPIATGFNR